GWLGLSLLMLLFLPVYQALLGVSFSHAYYGAIRHAVTVGFISQMIVGMSSLVVPLTPRDATLRPTFVLLNLGCALRVGLQICTDWSHVAFRLIGVSGVLELLALLAWAVVLSKGLLGARGQSTDGTSRPIAVGDIRCPHQPIDSRKRLLSIAPWRPGRPCSSCWPPPRSRPASPSSARCRR